MSGSLLFFFFNDTATTEIYTLSLHDALPISTNAGRYLSAQFIPVWPSIIGPTASAAKIASSRGGCGARGTRSATASPSRDTRQDRKSTRLNSSHANISYAVFCLKKKKSQNIT